MGEEAARLPQLRLDELLDELQVRIDAVRGTRDRVHSLLEAVLSVGGELDLPQVLRRIVEAAVVLVDAEYGALGVIEGTGLSQFLTSGISAEQARAIGPLPSGHGLLGELIRHPEPLRLTEICDHPASRGFPAGHPPMHSFLGVPIRVRDEVFGNIYLTEKHGGADFDGEDEAILRTLAVAAGVAIENARLYKAARERQRWLEANAQIVGDLLSGADEMAVLRGIVGHASHILDADLGVIALPFGESTDLQVVIAVGVDAEAHSGLVLPVEGSFMGAALAAGVPSPPARYAMTRGPRSARRGGRGSGPWWRSPCWPRTGHAGCCCWAVRSTPSRSRGTRRPRWRPSPDRPRWPWNWPSAAGPPSRWRCWRTATGSPVTCTTWPFSGSSPPA